MQTEADKLKDVIAGCTGIPTKIIAVGIGSEISVDELNTIATDPDDKNVILVDDFNSFDSLDERLAAVVCEGRLSSVTSM